jgi:MoaE-MoaD fusion protein
VAPFLANSSCGAHPQCKRERPLVTTPYRHFRLETHNGRASTLGVVRVLVKLFAAVRERAGTGERALELDAGTRVSDVWAALELGREPDGLLYAVNREYAEPDRPLREGDEVALIPPVSGGAFVVTERPLSLEAVVAEVADERAGAIATFTGTVRSVSRGRDVERLEYEAYTEMAESVMAGIATVLRARYDLHDVAIHHRVGDVGIGEASVVIAVSAPHRADALAACQDAIDTLKETVPLWKKEVYEGGEEWIGRGS